jgi:hypothetical protein
MPRTLRTGHIRRLTVDIRPDTEGASTHLLKIEFAPVRDSAEASREVNDE